MSYTALYRQWRPRNFDDLVGQDHVRITLKQAITTGRVAHAYLFAGPRGTGKTSAAKVLAKALNCAQGPTADPCGECDSCRKITAGSSMDVLEIDAASNRGIDEIRELRESVKFAAADSRYKVYIIDEVHMLTTEAFNALLKTLEEPPAHVVFILATTEVHKIPATILSRCQRYDFHRIATDVIVDRLQLVLQSTGTTCEEQALFLIARHADGGMRDALSILDQCLVMAEQGIRTQDVLDILGMVGDDYLFELTDNVLQGRIADNLLLLDQLIRLGKDVRQIVVEWIGYLRNLLLLQNAPHSHVADVYSGNFERVSNQAVQFTYERLTAVITRLADVVNDMKTTSQPRIFAEIGMIALGQERESMADVLRRLERLEQRVTSQPVTSEKLAAAGNRSMPTIATASVTSPAQEPDISLPKDSSLPQVTHTLDNPDCMAIWQTVLDTIKSRKRSLHAMIGSCSRLLRIQDQVLVIGFDPEHGFAKERVEKGEREDVEQAAAIVLGHPCRIQCCLGFDGLDNKAEVPEPGPLTPEQEPMIKKALDIFGGTIVEIKEE